MKAPEFAPSGPIHHFFKVVTNTDLTEGRGSLYVKNICLRKSTALRLATRAGVQGSDAEILQVMGFTDNSGLIWVRLLDVPYSAPTERDIAEDQKYEFAQELLKKIKSLNLTETELQFLTNPDLSKYIDTRGQK